MLSVLLQHLCHFVGYELDLGANDNLNCGLRRTHYASHACSLDLLLVDERAVLDFQTQTGNAVIQRFYIFLAAQTFEDCSCNCGEVVICQLGILVNLCEVGFFILTARGLEVELGDRKVEYQIEYNECCDTCLLYTSPSPRDA